jgi:hypothetical protein
MELQRLQLFFIFRPLVGMASEEGWGACAQVLPDALQALEDAVLGCDKDVAVEACSSIQQVLAGSDDYTRKILLVRWYMQLAAACSLKHSGQPLTGNI